MKKSKILAASLGMMILSVAASVTGTVAWFTANNVVNVSGMSIAAESENGIVIANETHSADSNWLTTVTASHDGGSSTFIPTSTANLTTWYHGLSDEVDNGQHNVDYDTFATPTVTDGVASATAPEHFPTDAKNIYLVNSFWVQASAKQELTGYDLYIEKIAIEGATNSTLLDKSIRVGLKVADTFKAIYAPLASATLTYGVNGAASGVTAIDVSGADDSNLIYTGNIPAYTTAGTNAIKLDIFVYFEGEDANHKSANITNTLDTLSLSFKIKNVKHA